MTGRKPKSARAVATQVLNRCNPEENYAGPVLGKLLHKTEQRQRATDLVFGTLRNRRAVDMVIAKFSGRPVQRIPEALLNIIRIGTYELVYSPAVEEYAIVSEAVENAKFFAGKKQAGFVNAVLRQITRHISNRQVPLTQAGAERTLPQTSITGCEFDTCFLPDRETCPADYLSVVFSLPGWLVTDWLAEFGEESTRQICFASNRRPSIYLRPNPLRITAQGLTDKLNNDNIDAEIVEGTMIKLKSPKAISNLPGFVDGEFTVQDITASQPVLLLDPQPDWTILDLCAAPGVKTTQLAEATGDSATIVATDIDSGRLEIVKENTTRLGVSSVEIVPYEKILNSQFTIHNSNFDCILLDVPCSNTGVLAKRLEARYRISPKAIQELAKIQGELLRTAAAMVKPRGRICYSTCSIQKDENSKLVGEFLKENPTFRLDIEKLILPSTEGFDRDGGYTAILLRK
ncbi:MAG: transcription antitermination factor NusB [Planctomycetota bacterium]|jgi:16S rRNA (cytosine967-C5)-methyltransferase